MIKRKVFDAAFSSSVLYSCESWFGADLKPVSKMYTQAIKHMLGVRYSACTDLCLYEAGFAPVEAVIRDRQRTAIKRLWDARRHMDDDPFAHTMNLVTSSRYVTSTYLTSLLNSRNNIIQDAMNFMKTGIETSTSTRRITYREVTNPELSISEIYFSEHLIPEDQRTAYTRFRVISHSLAVETGRWNRRGRGRLPLEERLCPCGTVQTEEHVVQHCPMSQHLRDEYNIASMQQLNGEDLSFEEKCQFIFKITQLFKT